MRPLALLLALLSTAPPGFLALQWLPPPEPQRPFAPPPAPVVREGGEIDDGQGPRVYVLVIIGRQVDADRFEIKNFTREWWSEATARHAGIDRKRFARWRMRQVIELGEGTAQAGFPTPVRVMVDTSRGSF